MAAAVTATTPRHRGCLARWRWEQFAGPLSAQDAMLSYAENRCLFESQTEAESATDALLRRLLG